MPVISGGRVIEGAVGPILTTGVPGAGTNEVQTLTIGGTPTGGTFRITFEGFTTTAIPWSSTNATLLASINSALDALPNVGTGGLVATAGTLTAGIGTILLTAAAALARKAIATAVVSDNSMTGTSPTAVIAETTPGVDATYRGAGRYSIVVNDATGIAYINTSATAGQPTWVVVGSQS